MGQRPQDEFDERWAELVARLDDGAAPQWPEDEVDDESADEPGDDAARHGGRVVRPAGDALVLSGRDWAGTDQIDAAEEAVDELEHFVPPDPGPVLGGDPLRTLTWSVAVGVPLLYVVVLVVWRHPPGWLAPVAGVLFLTAIGVLVWRMPHRRDEQDDDSGAVV